MASSSFSPSPIKNSTNLPNSIALHLTKLAFTSADNQVQDEVFSSLSTLLIRCLERAEPPIHPQLFRVVNHMASLLNDSGENWSELEDFVFQGCQDDNSRDTTFVPLSSLSAGVLHRLHHLGLAPVWGSISDVLRRTDNITPELQASTMGAMLNLLSVLAESTSDEALQEILMNYMFVVNEMIARERKEIAVSLISFLGLLTAEAPNLFMGSRFDNFGMRMASIAQNKDMDERIRLEARKIVLKLFQLATGDEGIQGNHSVVPVQEYVMQQKKIIEMKNEEIEKLKAAGESEEDWISWAVFVVKWGCEELFGFIAVELGKFVEAHPNSEMKDKPAKYNKLGFIISCPVDQAVATSGTAITWKSFAADSTLGKKLVNDFNRALEEHGVKLSVYAMVDDTVGTLAGGRYYNRESVAAITLGMGTDAAYVEPADAALQWHGPSPKLGEMVISTQWGEFSTHLPITIFDTCLDAESSNPGFRRFEKLVSGMYLGEVVRRVLLKMAKETALFGQRVVPSKLMTPYQLSSPDMAAIHQDTSDNREVVGEKLEEVFGIKKSTPMVREVVAEVCDIVAERGARPAGAGILGIIKKLGRIENKKSIVTVEGGLYEHYRVFRNYLNSGVWKMLGDNLSDNVVIENSHGGSGTGALYLAASQMKDADKSQKQNSDKSQVQDSDPDPQDEAEAEPEL